MTATGGPTLELRAVTAGYGRSQVLHDISLEVAAGGVTALLGANGAGKTTTLRAVSGMIRHRGTVRVAGRTVSGLRPDQIARLGLAHVPQGRGTLTRLTTEENLLVGALRRNDPAWADDPAVLEYLDRMETYGPDADPLIANAVWGYATADTMARTLESMTEMTREGLMDAVHDLRADDIAMLLPGVTLDGSAADAPPVTGARLQRFGDGQWNFVEE